MSYRDRDLDRLENHIQYVQDESLREILLMLLEEIKKLKGETS